MASWMDLLDDPTSVRAIYGDDVPSLESVHLHEITLHSDGARVTLRFDLSRYPADPPRKWQVQGFNTVQIQLVLLEVRELTLHGWRNRIDAALSLTKEDGGLRVVGSADSVAIDIKGEWATVAKISAYLSRDEG